jgi:hypothetical protein
MTEKLILFSFVGIVGALVFHLFLTLVLPGLFLASPLFQTYWYVPHIILPVFLLLGFAWWLGFFRPRNSRWADLGMLLMTTLIVLCTIGAPYNCLNQFCF